jgi:hypothetical protein
MCCLNVGQAIGQANAHRLEQNMTQQAYIAGTLVTVTQIPVSYTHLRAHETM